jgi:flagellar hook-basal body complex protein FliE
MIKTCTLAIAAALLTAGCASTYYKALETVGIEKRDVLVDRIDDARDSQDAAKEQFKSALEKYREVISVEGGDLEKTYDRLNAAYERSERRAEEVRNRVSAVETVAEDLFEEWEGEIEEYSDANLRRQSTELLAGTRDDYRDVITAMRRAEESMGPVLTLFHDQVLFLRHNLNARAIGSLQAELDEIEEATTALIAEMEQAIEEANRFIEAAG